MDNMKWIKLLGAVLLLMAFAEAVALYFMIHSPH